MNRSLGPALAAVLVVAGIGGVYGVRSLGDDTGSPGDTSPLRLEGLEVGDAPATGYWHAGVLRIGGGERRIGTGGLADLTAYAALDDGVLITGPGPVENDVVRFLPNRGKASPIWEASLTMFNEAVAVSGDRSIGAFVRRGNTPVLIDAGRIVERSPVPGDRHSVGYPVSVTNDGTVIAHADPLGDGALTWTVTGTDTVAARLGVDEVEAVSSDGLVAGNTRVIDDGDGNCAGVADRRARVLWQTCRVRLVDFSPGGRYLLGSQDAADSFGDDELSVYESRTGKRVLHLKTGDEETGIFQMRWEDDRHLLLVLGEQGNRDASDNLTSSTWSVVRLDLAGGREYAVAPVDKKKSPHLPAVVLPVQ